MEAIILSKNGGIVLEAVDIVLLYLLPPLQLLVHNPHNQGLEVSAVDVTLQKAGLVGIPTVLAKVLYVFDFDS